MGDTLATVIEVYKEFLDEGVEVHGSDLLELDSINSLELIYLLEDKLDCSLDGIIDLNSVYTVQGLATAVEKRL